MTREDFVGQPKLHGNKTKIKMSSIKDQGGSIIVHEVDLRISSIVNNKLGTLGAYCKINLGGGALNRGRRLFQSWNDTSND